MRHVDATDQEAERIEKWLDAQHGDGDPYIGPLGIISFEEFLEASGMAEEEE